METTTTAKKHDKKGIEAMFAAGVHFGLGKSRRHPTVAPYIFGTKNSTDIFDLEKTQESLATALDKVATLAKEGKSILFVGGKKEASASIKNAALALNMPYVNGRWIGGSLSNFTQIRKRIDRFEKLVADRDKGELAKYTKRERMLIDKEIASLDKMFSGIVSLKKMPDALFIVDPRHEKNAVKEAADMNIPVIALAGSDCNLATVDCSIVGNDASKASIQYFIDALVETYSKNKKIS